MMHREHTSEMHPTRFATGIPGLDTVLNGGFLRENVYLLMGSPGTGKTILANQMCFHHAAQGQKVVYITVLSETHGAMLQHIRNMGFYDHDLVSDALSYYSGYSALDEGGLEGLFNLVRGIMKEEKPSLLVFDGMANVELMMTSGIDFKRFVHQLQIRTSAHNCTSFLLSHTHRDITLHPINTMVDGIVELNVRNVGVRTIRELEVRKLRGTPVIHGRHLLTITEEGIAVSPRTEALYQRKRLNAFDPDVRMSFGIEQFDGMLGGGLHARSTAMVVGNSGGGKTLLGMHFLSAGADQNEPSLYVGFSEPPPELIAKGDATGLGFSDHVKAGRIGIIWQPPLETLLDPMAEQILREVEERGVKRLFVDGLRGMQQAAISPERVPRFFTALCNELRARDVTTLFSAETRQHRLPRPAVVPEEVAAVASTMIYLRQRDLHSRTHRLISIAKMRHGVYDPNTREFTISESGINIADTNESAEQILMSGGAPYGPHTQTPSN